MTGGQERLIEHLQALIRIRTENPPGNEIVAAQYLAGLLAEGGVAQEILEPFPGRGSVVGRIRGDGSAGEPLLLLGHLDVVPAEPQHWTHDPFGAAIEDGYLYGRGTLDMKSMVAMSLGVVLALAADMRTAGLDPARDVHPALGRDVIFAATADEETGGHRGAGWVVENRPELISADAAITEAGGVSIDVLGRRFYPIGVGEKGFHRFRITVQGASGHGSVPRPDSTIIRLGQVLVRLGEPTPVDVIPLLRDALSRVAAELPPRIASRLRGAAEGEIDSLSGLANCDPALVRTLNALLRTTVTPTIVSAGQSENVIPGTAEIVVDCRTLPGATPESTTAKLVEHLGTELSGFCEIETINIGAPLLQPLDHPILEVMAGALKRADREAIPIPMLASFFSDAKHTVRLGIPTYGFSPLRLGPKDGFVGLFHGHDERVAIEALLFGFAVLEDVVRAYSARVSN